MADRDTLIKRMPIWVNSWAEVDDLDAERLRQNFALKLLRHLARSLENPMKSTKQV
jgi:hypothetical protein